MEPIAVKLSPRDYLLGQKHVAESLRRRGPWYWPIRVLQFAILFVAFFGFLGLFTFESRLPGDKVAVRTSAVLLLSSLLLVGVAAWLHQRSISAVLFKPGSKLLEPYLLTVNDPGISVATVTGQAEIPWRSIERIEISGGRIYMFTSPTHALIVPASSFSSEAEFTSLATTLHERWRASAV